MRELMRRAHAVSEAHDAAAILCGDFNCTPGSLLHAYLAGAAVSESLETETFWDGSLRQPTWYSNGRGGESSPPVYISIYLSMYRHMYVFIYLSIYLPAQCGTPTDAEASRAPPHVSIYLFIYVSTYVCLYLCMYVCTYLSIDRYLDSYVYISI